MRYIVTLLLCVVLGSFGLSQDKHRVGINTENPGETAFRVDDLDKNILDINGNLIIREIPEVPVEQAFTAPYFNRDTKQVLPEYGERLYFNFGSGVVEAFRLPSPNTARFEKPFTLVKYKLKTANPGAHPFKNDLIEDFNTNIDASRYFVFIVDSYLIYDDDPSLTGVRHVSKYEEQEDTKFYNLQAFQIVSEGSTINPNDPSLERPKAMRRTNAVENIRTFMRNGTWRIHADYLQARVNKSGAGAFSKYYPHTWYISVLVIDNRYVSRIKVTPNRSEKLDGIIFDRGSTPPLVPDPGYDVKRRGGSFFNNAPTGSLPENPLTKPEWQVQSNEKPAPEKHYEYY